MIKTDEKTLNIYRKKQAGGGEIIGDNDGYKYKDNVLPDIPRSVAKTNKKERA